MHHQPRQREHQEGAPAPREPAAASARSEGPAARRPARSGAPRQTRPANKERAGVIERLEPAREAAEQRPVERESRLSGLQGRNEPRQPAPAPGSAGTAQGPAASRASVGRRAGLAAAQERHEDRAPISAPPRLGSSGPTKARRQRDGWHEKAGARRRAPSRHRAPIAACLAGQPHHQQKERRGEQRAWISATLPASAALPGRAPRSSTWASVGVPTAPKDTPAAWPRSASTTARTGG
jgi:hypothetical protein